MTSGDARHRPARARIGLDPSEATVVAERFGVAMDQVERDHAISHALGAIAEIERSNDLVFFGGTALARTHLPDLRLSEDIDLIARGSREAISREIAETVEMRLARQFTSIRWAPDIRWTKGSEAATLELNGRIRIQVQLLGESGYPRWPTERRTITQRYSDAPEATLQVLTRPAFVAAKTAAWMDRRAPRDLYDLWALARSGFIDEAAAQLLRRHGPQTSLPSARTFADTPSQHEWDTALSLQCRPVVGPQEAAEVVTQAWQALAGRSPA